MAKKKDGSMEWEVLVQACLEQEEEEHLDENDDRIDTYEVSVIRKGYAHGHNSWGWDSAEGDDNDKIILFSNDHNNLGVEEDDTVPKDRWEWALNVAQEFCNMLNRIEGFGKITDVQKIALEGLMRMNDAHLKGMSYQQLFISTFGTKRHVIERDKLSYDDAVKMIKRGLELTDSIKW